MIRCPDVQGLLVTGDSISQVLEEFPVVVQALYEACQEKGWTFIYPLPSLPRNTSRHSPSDSPRPGPHFACTATVVEDLRRRR